MGNILAILRDMGKSPVARILMFDLRIVVGLLFPPTLSLCLRLVIILVTSGIDDGWKFSASGNLINKIIFKY